MRVLVTGMDGFTGVYLASRLKASGCEAIALQSDLTDADALNAELASLRPDRVIHLAGKAFVADRDVTSFYMVNQIGTYNLLEAVARAVPDTHVLIASSAAMYQGVDGEPITETTSIQPPSHYAMSKWFMELGASFWRDRMQITVARPFNYTGVGQPAHFLVPKIVEHFRQKKADILLGNLEISRDFSDVRAVVGAYVQLSLAAVPTPLVNICSGSVWSIRQIIEFASKTTGHQLEVSTNPAFVRANDVAVLRGDPAHLRQLLPEWAPVPFSETLTWMLSA